MCHFISWIEHNDKNWFLTKNELSTDKGKELIEYCGDPADIVGHGAIRQYYNFTGGFNKECTDFTNPDRFPPEIVQAIKDGLFEGMGVAPKILTEEAREKYDRIRIQAWGEYNRIKKNKHGKSNSS